MARVKVSQKEKVKTKKKRTVKAVVKTAVKSAVRSTMKKAVRRRPKAVSATSFMKEPSAAKPARPKSTRPAPRVSTSDGRAHHYNNRWMAFAWVVPVMTIAIAVSVLTKSAKVAHPITLTSARLVSYFEQAQSRPLGERIAFWSENLLKNPALLSVMGHGPTVDDTAPVFPDAYDCTTYVETVGALARSESGEVLADRIISIRYRNGKPGFETRNHFPEADWIPNNEAAGILKDVTVEIARKAGFVVSFVNKDIDKIAWFKAQGVASRTVAAEPAVATVRLAYLPLDRINETLQHVPQGSVINVVRASRDRYPVLISHQGLLIWKNGVPYFRHASRTRQIRETPFSEYVQTLRGMPWKVLGFNINTFEG